MQSNTLNSFSKGMYLDSVPSMQPDGTYRAALNAVTENHDYNSFGIGNEPSNELCFKVPDGYKICGWGFIEERDEFVVFSHNETTKVSQIGVGNTKTCEYKIVLEDKDPERFINKFCFSTSEKITPTFKHLRPCNDLWMYWSNNFTYYRLNLDADICDIKYDDIVLFDCKCPSVINTFVLEGGSDLLDVGAYQFVCQLIDDDKNRTNWFRIGNPVVLSSLDNKLGDKSDQAVLIEISNLPKTYPKVVIGVVKTIGGVQTPYVITEIYHNGNKISYVYRGSSEQEEPIDISEILSRRTGYIQGKDLIQRDGKLFLYNLKEEWNLNAQKVVNKIVTKFNAWKLPAKFAGDYPTLPRGEVISLAAVFNYCDGTSSLGFHVSGRRGSADDFEIIETDDPYNCTNCNKYKWQIENTAYIEKSLCSSNVFDLNTYSKDSQEVYVPERVLYKKVSKEWIQNCKTASDINAGHLTNGLCGNGGDCEGQGDCESGSCIDGTCNSGNCPVLGIPCSTCNICNGSYLSDTCDDNSNVGSECYDCQGENNFVNNEIVRGIATCDGEECVDGICPSTGLPCEFCTTCGGGDWYVKVVEAEKYVQNNSDIPLSSNFDDCPNGEPIYDSSGCSIIGYKPSKIAVGSFGYWESTEKYPLQKDCEGDYFYGELAGQPIRHHLVPSEELIPFSISKNKGVVCDIMPDNFEYENTDVIIIGLEFCNIELPANPPKPYCPNNPVSIYWQKIDPKDRRITARGLLTHTFLGAIGNKYYAVPKNGVNSLEYFDRHLNQQNSYERGGVGHFDGQGQNSFTFHSPDTQFQKIPLLADRLEVPYELTGTGKRYGIYAEGEEPINMWHTTTNQRGTRQAINLNKTIPTSIERRVVAPPRCTKLVDITGVAASFVIENPAGGGRVRNVYVNTVIELFKNEIIYYTLKVINKRTNKTRFEQTVSDNSLSTTVPALAGNNDIDIEISFVAFGGCRYNVKKSISINVPNSPNDVGTKIDLDIRDVKSDDYFVGGEIVTPGTIKRCVKGLSYAKKDSIVSKEDRFTYPLLNLKRESSVYLELDGDRMILSNAIDPYLSDKFYNGLSSSIPADSTSDGSFLGDVICQSCPIHNASALFGVLINDSPSQYGRIENASYIPLGFDITADEIVCRKAERYGIGDSYVGLYSFRRFSVVSDKLKNIENQYPPTDGNLRLLFGAISIPRELILCTHDCSEIPENCNPRSGDLRHEIALREFDNRGCWDGQSLFDGVGLAGDYYHPHTQNTLVHFWTESRINLNKRSVGVVDPYSFGFSNTTPVSSGGQVHYRNLKSLELDPEFPKGTSWEKAWLSRHGVNWRTIAILKKWAIMFIKLLILLMFTISIVGLVVALDTSINTAICKFLYKVFKVRQCSPRCRNGSENCYINDSDILPIEDNYTGYNWDYNTQNTLETKLGIPDPYNTCICDVGEGNQIVYSAKQNPLSATDAYKNFLPNSYINIPADFGKIQSLFLWGNNFFAQTSDIIINIATADGIINLGNGQVLDVVTQGGDLRTQPKEIVSGVPEGFAGSRDPNSAINTQFGRFFVDREGKKIFQFSGGLPQEISNFGIRNFLKENLELELHRQFPDYKLVDEAEGIGYRFGFDHRFNKLMFTKIDYKVKFPEKIKLVDGIKFYHNELGRFVEFGDEAHFINKSFTLSYDPINKRWISFHTYIPDGYAWDRDHLYSIKDGGFWKHGDKYGSYQMFYDHYHPHAVEFVLSRDGIHSQFTDLTIDVESNKFDGNNWINGARKTFDRGLFYNDKQSTGFIDLVEKDKEDAISAMKEGEKEATIEWQTDVVRVNDLVDRVVDPESPIFDGKANGISLPNDENIGEKKGKFEGKYLVARLILDEPDASNIQHMLKRVITKQDTTIR